MDKSYLAFLFNHNSQNIILELVVCEIPVDLVIETATNVLRNDEEDITLFKTTLKY